MGRDTAFGPPSSASFELPLTESLDSPPAKRLAAGSSEGMGDDWPGGFFCPCHGSKFDLSGRVFKNVPAPRNLPVPPHKYLSESRILIGEDQA